MTHFQQAPSRLRAFTLIELLVVIAIIGVLAGMLIPAGVHLKTRASIKMVQTQKEQISTWIESYKAKLGQYPPGRTNNLNPNWKDSEVNPAIPARPALLYELTGAELTPTGYRMERGPVFTTANLNTAFGIGLIANSSQPGGNPDDSPKKQSFAPNVDVNSIAQLTVSGVPFPVEVLASKIRGPMGLTNVWHYTVDQGNRNPNSFDLWLDVVLGGKTYRICNWSPKPIKL